MAHLGRIRLMARIIRKFLINLKRHHAELYQDLGDVALRYEEKNAGRFSVEPSESAMKLQEVGSDCFLLVERFKSHEVVVAMYSYYLLRLFTEQCVLEKMDSTATVIIKPNKDVSSDSLQNPSDPDAVNSGHKGKGYQMQVMETYSPAKSRPGLITHRNVEPAHESDANSMLPAIDAAAKRELAPSELLADSLYYSDDNVERAKEQRVEVVAPARMAPLLWLISSSPIPTKSLPVRPGMRRNELKSVSMAAGLFTSCSTPYNKNLRCHQR